MLDRILRLLLSFLERFTEYADDSRWKDQRFDHTSGDLDYKGYNARHKAATTLDNWYIWKYTWVSGNCVRIEGPLIGVWDNRATMAWG